jgi:hypothetical protein
VRQILFEFCKRLTLLVQLFGPVKVFRLFHENTPS